MTTSLTVAATFRLFVFATSVLKLSFISSDIIIFIEILVCQCIHSFLRGRAAVLGGACLFVRAVFGIHRQQEKYCA